MQNHEETQQLAKGVWKHDIHVDIFFNVLNTTLTSLLKHLYTVFYVRVTIYSLNICF
jgi:hypothetical protein